MKKTFCYLLLVGMVLGLIGYNCVSLVQASTTYSTSGSYFTWNGFKVLNNQWGASYATNSDYYQYIVSNDNGSISYRYKWAGSSAYVKGYPTIIAGWHYGNPGGWMTTSGNYGLPSLVSAGKSYNTSITGTHYNAGTYTECLSLSWDIWLAASSSPSVPNGEIMVWPYRVNQTPIGSKKTSVSIWGYTWDVYYGSTTVSGNTWYVTSYLRQNSTITTSTGLSMSGDLKTFISDAKSRGYISSGQYIVGIENGTEIMQGDGSFNWTAYSLSN